MIAEIMAALKALQVIASALVLANEQRKEMMEAHEQKQIEEFKRGVRNELEQIKVAANDVDRKRLIVELSRRLQG